ncbi:hypothetical protein [Deinococcus koreensis]|uniref:hypothetical protein n=1 Tax=Deinococcus koreensis TaxID=2054903 RepID=UPI001057226D|nr:hypothetical protein [Deinococcus koreensis]
MTVALEPKLPHSLIATWLCKGVEIVSAQTSYVLPKATRKFYAILLQWLNVELFKNLRFPGISRLLVVMKNDHEAWHGGRPQAVSACVDLDLSLPKPPRGRPLYLKSQTGWHPAQRLRTVNSHSTARGEVKVRLKKVLAQVFLAYGSGGR